ncbi:hypothetical protein [Pelagicoccus sp. SDUM812003]|uniref:hypothetical protein n=1 Tax=Pelagicoccus sp. SDUM812003 TaxID=3041267 RepID=UPI00280C7996|nr:hypothetical protein [Pelagicoccus sp. SDUM812003]MDQ8205761.1 hypothetical protein [Pelagicoccus sp. SDUM812003]
MNNLDPTTILIGIAVLLLFFMLLKISAILDSLKLRQNIENLAEAERIKRHEELIDSIEKLTIEVESCKSEIQDVRHVTDLIEKYKLPNREEQEALDEIAINEEVFGGIEKARKKNT